MIYRDGGLTAVPFSFIYLFLDLPFLFLYTMEYIFYLFGFLFAAFSLEGGLIFFLAGSSLAMVGVLLDYIKNG